MAPIRLLLVDDHPLARAGTHRLLEGEADFVVAGEAADGEAALILAERIPLDIVVLDLHLPGLSGVEVARRLRSTKPDIRIVVLTGYAVEPYMPVRRRLGVQGYPAKSASAGKLAAALRTVYAGRSYVQAELVALFEQTATDDAEAPTARELEVLRLVATGSTNREIAQVWRYRSGRSSSTWTTCFASLAQVRGPRPSIWRTGGGGWGTGEYRRRRHRSHPNPSRAAYRLSGLDL